MSFRLEKSDIEIRRIITDYAIKQLKKEFYSPRHKSAIESIVRKYVINAIKQSFTWQALEDGIEAGSLGAHFGIPKSEKADRLKKILEIWANEITVKPRMIERRNTIFVMGYTFYAIKSDWANVLSLNAGITINTSKNHPEGQRLPWLQWLLVDGDSLTITDYHILYEGRKGSRSGEAIMVPKGIWRIPPDFGPFSADNNFVTIALEGMIKNNQFKNEITETFKSMGKSSEGSLFSMAGVDVSDI